MKTSLLTVGEGSSQHRTWQAAWWALFAVVVIALPYIIPLYQVSRMNRALFMAVAILGLNLVIGYSGLIALGHSAFIGIGAFTTTTLVQDHRWDYWMTIPAAMLFAFVVGFLFGFPALKIKGLYLALLTVAFATAFPTLAKIDKFGIADRTGGVNGRNIDEKMLAPDWVQSVLGIEVEESVIYRYFVIAGLTALTFLFVRNLLKSRPGRAIIAIRDNETGAAVSGVNVPLYKTLTFGVSAAFGGLAGVMWAMDRAFVAEQDFGFVLAIDLLVGLVIGGVATLQGGLAGALVVVFVREWTKGLVIPFFGLFSIDGGGPLSQAIFGALLIVVTFFAPGGLVSLGRMGRAKLITVIPRPPEGVSAGVDLTGTADKMTESV
ncbi:MAG: branched-chain amino acid ABC transporter permease [Actinomycetia bacterium]|nr:branched-chain amino acid ABC transporter permease [Actinomycetes bacterium]